MGVRRFLTLFYDWEQRKLDNMVDVYGGRDYKHLAEGDIPVYGTGGYMLSVNEALSYYKDAIGIGRKGTINKPYILEAPFWTVDTLFYAIPKEGNYLIFIFNLFENIDWKKKDESTGVPSLSKAAINDIDIYVTRYSEQKAIGRFFYTIDNLITLHQRKLEKLKTFKKAMLDKMFPKNGELVPEIRFSGFTDPWEQRKLLGCIEKITDFRGRTPKKLGMDWNESGYLALSALNVKDGYIDFSQNVHYGDQALYNEWMSGNELHEGQVLFTTEAPMGNVAQVPDNKRYILSQRTIAFDVKEDVITENFLATLLRSPAVFNTLTSLSSGGTAKGVSQKSLAGVGVQVPVDLKEQTLLADYFHSLNNLITLHQRKLEKLQNIKKSMLNKMFI